MCSTCTSEFTVVFGCQFQEETLLARSLLNNLWCMRGPDEGQPPPLKTHKNRGYLNILIQIPR